MVYKYELLILLLLFGLIKNSILFAVAK